MQQIIRQLAAEIKVGEQQVRAAVELLDGGATVPFIARYRKEVTGGLDDIQLRELEARLSYLRELDERRAAVLKSIDEQGKLTDALRAAIAAAPTKQELEDIYLPFKQKRRTKGQMAREFGIEPLADKLFADPTLDPAAEAVAFIRPPEVLDDGKTGADFSTVPAVLDGVPGVTTEALDQLCHDHIVNVQGARPANVGYLGYPKTVLTSVNHVVCHGIPSPQQTLKKGDIVNIDVAVEKDGWYGDTSRMFCVGTPSTLAQRLVHTTYEALCAGIREVKPGATLGDVGHAIAAVAHREKFSVVREYCGHGIGTMYHDEPQVLHYGRRGQGLRLEAGMVFTIEPMLNAGQRETKELADGWTVVTQDRSLSAQWEHMVAVTGSGYEVLTAWPGGTGVYPPI